MVVSLGVPIFRVFMVSFFRYWCLRYCRKLVQTLYFEIIVYFEISVFEISRVVCNILQPVQRDAEVTAEDIQVFLMKQQTQLSKQPAPGSAGVSCYVLVITTVELHWLEQAWDHIINSSQG